MSRSSQVRPSLKRSHPELTGCHHDSDGTKRQRGTTRPIMIRRPSTAPDFTSLLLSGSRPLPVENDEQPMSPPNEDSESFGPSVLEEELVSGTIIPLDQAMTLRRSLPTPDASQGDFYPFASRSPIRSSGGSKRRKSSSIIADDAFEDEWPGYRAHPTGLLVQEDMKPHYFPNKATKPCVASETKPRRARYHPAKAELVPSPRITCPPQRAGPPTSRSWKPR